MSAQNKGREVLFKVSTLQAVICPKELLGHMQHYVEVGQKM